MHKLLSQQTRENSWIFVHFQSNIDIEWKFVRSQIYSRFIEAEDCTPPPFNIFPTVRKVIKYGSLFLYRVTKKQKYLIWAKPKQVIIDRSNFSIRVKLGSKNELVSGWNNQTTRGVSCPIRHFVGRDAWEVFERHGERRRGPSCHSRWHPECQKRHFFSEIWTLGLSQEELGSREDKTRSSDSCSFPFSVSCWFFEKKTKLSFQAPSTTREDKILNMQQQDRALMQNLMSVLEINSRVLTRLLEDGSDTSSSYNWPHTWGELTFVSW